MWFSNRDDVGVVFHEYFTPIPFEVIALSLTVVRVKAMSPFLDADGLRPLLSDRVLHLRVVYRHIQRVYVDRTALPIHLHFASQLAP
jgi:hypothetical protein